MRKTWMGNCEFDSSKKIVETDTEVVVPAILTREAILPFRNPDTGKIEKGYRPAAELKDAGWTLENAWVVARDHTSTVFVTNRADIWGKVQNVRFCNQINAILGDIHFFKAKCDKAFLETVKKGDLKDVSPAYFVEDVFAPGEFAGEKYDFVQQNFMFGHLAAGIQEGRCPSPFCGMNVDSLFAKPHTDPEVTEKYVRIRVRDPNLFVDGSFRTIVLSAKEGIHAIIGKLKSDPKGPTVVQNYMFELAKDWTMEKAQAWVKQHKDSVDAMSLEEIKSKIKELEGQRRGIMEKLYPKTQLTEEEQRKLGEELTILDAEMKAFTEFLTEKLGEASDNPAEPEKDSAEPLDPEKVLARSRELLKSR